MTRSALRRITLLTCSLLLTVAAGCGHKQLASGCVIADVSSSRARQRRLAMPILVRPRPWLVVTVRSPTGELTRSSGTTN